MFRFRLVAAFVAVVATTAGAASSVSAAGHVTVRCKGTEKLCQARVSLVGGASNKRVTVRLPGTSWRKPTVRVSSATLRGAYSLSGGRFTTGGSVYVVTLNAVGSIRTGYLLFTFRQP
jgi:hypothetical protein